MRFLLVAARSPGITWSSGMGVPYAWCPRGRLWRFGHAASPVHHTSTAYDEEGHTRQIAMGVVVEVVLMLSASQRSQFVRGQEICGVGGLGLKVPGWLWAYDVVRVPPGTESEANSGT